MLVLIQFDENLAQAICFLGITGTLRLLKARLKLGHVLTQVRQHC